MFALFFVVFIRIPRTAQSRRERTYAQLILRVPARARVHMFVGPVYFRTGASVEESALRPTDEYPLVPLLHEYAGNDRSGRGHNRSNDIHVLWKWDPAGRAWKEIARVLSNGPEWFQHLAPIVRREISAPPINFVEVAAKVTGRVLAVLDVELDALEDEGRERVMSFLFDQFAARLVDAPPTIRPFCSVPSQ